MRRLLSFLGLAAVCALGVAGLVAAAPRGDVAPPAAKSISIAAHRAAYQMSLGGVKNGSNITDVSGHMLFEWRDVCDGWAIQQHMQLHFAYSDGDDQDVTSTELTWEAKDGKSYNFNIRRMTNGKETENYRGKAIQNADGSVSVTYTVPENKHLELPVGTLFPSAHTQLILENAAAGQKFFLRRVFDGADEQGSSDISAFISPPRGMAQDASLAKLDKSPLLAQDAWPVHMAFFNPAGETGEPDYEMDLDLLPNGVARHMKIDYGDFAVAGSLQDIQPLPAPVCP